MSRLVKISTASFLIPATGETTTLEKNIEQALSLVDRAGKDRVDILCLPEAFAERGVPEADASTLAEPIPGPLTDRFAKKAKEYEMYIILPLHEREGDKLYNTAALIDREGRIVGKYRKVHPTPLEIRDGHITPGDEIPVFATDFGCIGIMICFDIYFPELVRVMTLKGAEIIFWPTIAHGPSEFGLEIQFRARAMDYSVYMVESNFIKPPPYAPYAGGENPGRARIADMDGHLLADTGHRPGLATAVVDLDEPRLASGVICLPERVANNEPDNMRVDILKCRRPELYGLICKRGDDE